MEKKRKLPPRGASRIDQASKKRTSTPPETRSVTPAPASTTPAVEVPPPPPPAAQLPKSIQPGKPLPVVDDVQPDDLDSRQYQSIQESGVAAESLSRSRQKWISEGVFEKYWTKPTKRKGVVIEEPNNPPKDSMSKIGAVTIIVEPHIFEATMYGVKDPKPPPATSVRPVLQYGPPNGAMPPPPLPASVSNPSTPTVAQSQSPLPASKPPGLPVPHQPPLDPQRPASAASSKPDSIALDSSSLATGIPRESPAPATNALNPTQAAPPSPATASATAPPTPKQAPAAAQPSFPSRPPPPPSATPVAANRNGAAPPTGAGSAPAAPSQPPGTDPIIVMLAEKATEDPELRELMKRVAHGQALKPELDRFQTIIDRITAETKRRGSTQGPSADRLLVCGKTVRYFADEVRAILDIVLTSNPAQTSAGLRPPDGSDPLVVLLVKAALDDSNTRSIVRRIAENRPQFADATDLKQILDQLTPRAARELGSHKNVPGPSKTSGVLNGSGQAGPAQQHAPQQALRSKGPPPAPKPDFAAVVFEFFGGTGDRYLFPKFSILEFIPGPGAVPQLLASFLVVRRGSTSEYGGDPNLDYWQPVTIRLQASTQRMLEHLTRVVASPEEVNRYMNDVMDNMTRAEYVLLAMRLPRAVDKEDSAEATGNGPEKETNGGGPFATKSELDTSLAQPNEGVLWTAKAGGPRTASGTAPSKSLKAVSRNAVAEDERYQKFIASVTPMEVDNE